jgi:hypothetical protein
MRTIGRSRRLVEPACDRGSLRSIEFAERMGRQQ